MVRFLKIFEELNEQVRYHCRYKVLEAGDRGRKTQKNIFHLLTIKRPEFKDSFENHIVKYNIVDLYKLYQFDSHESSLRY